jgi:hypothetical protein
MCGRAWWDISLLGVCGRWKKITHGWHTWGLQPCLAPLCFNDRFLSPSDEPGCSSSAPEAQLAIAGIPSSGPSEPMECELVPMTEVVGLRSST